MKPLHELDDDDLASRLRQTRVLRDAPDAVIERAIAVFDAAALAHQGRRNAAGPALLQRVLATLTFDSAGQSLLAHGVRSGAMSSRQVIYSADGRDIELRIVAANDAGLGSAGAQAGWVLFGQVLGPDREGEVELMVGEQRRQTVLDEMSEFRFDDVPGGAVQLSLRLADRVIELPRLDVPRPGSKA